mmetsp:Transcript_19710/g.19811  ORF Transcript_19710/g.19811 Transcript_19710/m.19811 type:complete len:240 (+) Transcript_19710:243-962(+)
MYCVDTIKISIAIILLVTLQEVYCIMPTKALCKSVSVIKSIATAAATKYTTCLSSHSLLTNVGTASVLTAFSDGIAQKFERESKKPLSNDSLSKHSFYRTFCMSLYGGLVFGGFMQYWYMILDYIIPKDNITMSLIAMKVLINQICISTPQNCLFFAYVIFTREFKSSIDDKLAMLQNKIKKDLLPMIRNAGLFWGTIQSFNFSFMSRHYPQYQILYTNIAFTFWSVFLSYMGYRKVSK